MLLSLSEVSLQVGQFQLRDISFDVPPGEMFVILGPNGAGKSVLMELIAGFYRPQAGRIRLAGREIAHLAPEQRQIGFVFQNYALFPHLTVAQNIQFALRLKKSAAAAARHRLDELLTQFSLTHVAGRKPQHLSGGEKQRVALARALAMDPALFLLDEPFAAVDERSREELGMAIKQLLAASRIPAVFVTHDQMEAQALADHLAIMQDGRIIQSGRPATIFNTPANAFIARFVGTENIVDAHIQAVEGTLALVRLGHATVHAHVPPQTVSSGQAVKVCIRPEDVMLRLPAQPPGDGTANDLNARVVSLHQWGPVWKVQLDCGVALTAYVMKHEARQLEAGQEIGLALPQEALHVLTG